MNNEQVRAYRMDHGPWRIKVGHAVLCAICCVLFLPVGVPAYAAVDLYLAPTHSTQVSGNNVTYDMYIRSDTDTKLEALGDVFLAYDRDRLRIVTGNVADRATQIRWTDRILDLDYKGQLYGVTGNIGVIRFAKISLREKMMVTANQPVMILSVPFEIISTSSFGTTRLYFPRAMMIDASHKNVLRNAADSFLIHETGQQRKIVRKRGK